MRRTVGRCLAVGICLLCCASSRDPVLPPVDAAPSNPFDSIVLDAGHGGEDFGARGRGGLLEKELVLDVSQRLARRLRARGLRVIETRTGDSFVPLETRTMLANDSGADLFLSIHANSSSSTTPRGIEVYFASLDATDASAQAVAERENQAFGKDAVAAAEVDPLVAIISDMIATESVREANAFARLAQTELDAIERVRSRGVKQAPFVVLLGVQMPASLVEIGFLSNPEEERSLASSGRRDALARALETAVLEYARRYDALHGIGREDR
jgi:N-acetylmuramoyl-L-alanine amidase